LITFAAFYILSKFVNNIKSVSSRRIRSEYTEHVNNFYWKAARAPEVSSGKKRDKTDVLWNESYFIASCGGVTVSVLRQYIESQNTPD
jgi:putative transposase